MDDKEDDDIDNYLPATIRTRPMRSMRMFKIMRKVMPLIRIVVPIMRMIILIVTFQQP